MNPTRLLIFLAIIILLIDLAYFYPKLTGEFISSNKLKYSLEDVNVTRIIDGDTIIVNENQTLRLLCVNAPEKNKQYYEEARDFLNELENKTIQILRDKEDSDQYERKLRYLFYQGTLVNKRILEQGLAHIYLCEDLEFEKELEKAEESARKNKLGIWKTSTSKCSSCIELLELNPIDEFFILKNNCNFSCNFQAKDEARHFFEIDIEAREEKTIESKGNIWNNDGDSLFIWDDEGLILYHNY